MDMNILQRAVDEANRFIFAATVAQKKYDEDWERDSNRYRLTTKAYYTNVSKENAACKRASLDLTRILARLRNR